MDHSENNKNKVKNWLHRLFKRHNCRQTRASTSDLDMQVQYNSLSEIRNCRQSSFRKSLKKVQTSMKSCIHCQDYRNSEPPMVFFLVQQQSAQQLSSAPPVPPRVVKSPVTTITKASNQRNLTDEVLSLSICPWYWGPMTTSEAEEKLKYKPDGTFLVRDSSSTCYLFSISFRSVGRTMHTRIEYNRGLYNLYGSQSDGFPTIIELIENAMKISENGIYCYSSRMDHDGVQVPVRLTKPCTRYVGARSLKCLCKFTIRQHISNIDDIPKLPLPTVLCSYLMEGPYF